MFDAKNHLQPEHTTYITIFSFLRMLLLLLLIIADLEWIHCI